MKPADPYADVDVWDRAIFKLAMRNVDPTRFGDLTYPMILTILNDGEPDKDEREHDRARRVMADLKAGRLAGIPPRPDNG